MKVPAFYSLDDANRAVRSVAQAVDGLARWQVTAVPTVLSTSTFYASDVSWWTPGTPLRWAQGGTTYYGMVASTAANVVTICGPALSTSVPITAMWFGTHSPIRYEMHADGAFADSTAVNAYYSISKKNMTWMGRDAYLVMVATWCCTVSGTPKLNMVLGGADPVLTTPIAITTTQTQSGVTINPDNYVIANQANISYDITTAGAGSADLIVELVFVEE